MNFKDNFSKLSAVYAKYRPAAPSELFDFLATLTPEHELALDCGTGNGQAAVQLAKHFRQVVATDPSAEQLRFATQHERVDYRVAKGEDAVLEPNSVDIVTVSQALHWFDFDAFYAEVKRVLKPNGILAVWAYPLPLIEPQIDQLIRHFHEDIVGPFWQYENRMIDKAYATIPFPFERLDTPAFVIHKDFSYDDLIGLLYTWSAVLKYREHHGSDPIAIIREELLALWGEPYLEKKITWPVILKVGRL